MDENIMSGLRNFNKVWNRVTEGSEASQSMPEDDHAVLRGFIADETHDAAYYSALAKRTRSAAHMLSRIAADEQNHKRELQVEYFLLIGDSYVVEPSCPVMGSVLDCLRMAYSNELEGARKYLAAAEHTKSERLREIYRQNASDETGHAEALRYMISRAIG